MDLDLSSKEDVVHDFLPFLRVFKDGRVERYILNQKSPPGSDPITGAQSKDVTISTDPDIRARIFLPKSDPNEPGRRLPVLVHYHGGGFCTGSAFGPMTKYTLSRLVSHANVVAVSIEYRLAPEHPLPAAFEDSWAGLRWVAAHAGGAGPDPWLNEHVDYGRVFVGGESAGGSLAHHAALQASLDPVEGVGLGGLIMVHPHFTDSGRLDPLMRFLYPTSSGSGDDPMLYPGADPNLSRLACGKVLVCVAGKDSLRERGVAYYEALKNSGWTGNVELVENEEEEHCFHVFNPSSETTKAFLSKLASFITQ